jgi:branched-chain amino acid transport system substrate-binding protein
MKKTTLINLLFGAAAFTAAMMAHAEITIGVSVSATGPGAAMGIAEKNTLELLPKTLGGQAVRYIILDDATDPATAGKNARRFVESDKVDVIIGSSTVPTSVAIMEAAVSSRTAQLALAPFVAKAEHQPWVFVMPHSVSLMGSVILDDLKARKVKSLGFIGFNDAYGEAWLKDMQLKLPQFGIALPVVERYARADQSVTGQVLKLIAANPDAILVAASGTPGVLPMRTLRERGYKGHIYQTHGVANIDFLRLAGNLDEGVRLPAGPVLVAEQLPDGHPSKVIGVQYVKQYEARFGPNSRNIFGAYAYDAYLVLDAAAAVAVKKAQPGSAEFRGALRDALEATTNLPVTHGVINMSKQDHTGLDERSRVLVSIESNTWKLAK